MAQTLLSVLVRLGRTEELAVDRVRAKKSLKPRAAVDIDRDAIQVLSRERIHEDLESSGLQNEVILRGLILDDEAVLEAAAAAGLDAHAQSALLDGDALGVHKLLDLNASIRRDDELDFRL